MRVKTIWTIRGDGSLEMDTGFQPFGQLPLLPRGQAWILRSTGDSITRNGTDAGHGKIILTAQDIAVAPTWASGPAV